MEEPFKGKKEVTMKKYEVVAGTPPEKLEYAKREIQIDLMLSDLTPRERERAQRTLAYIAFELSQSEEPDV